MPDTYRPLLRSIDMENSSNAGGWGDNADATFAVFEDAIAGETEITTTTGTKTLSEADNAPDEARRAILRFTGTLTADVTVEVPDLSKVYHIENEADGFFDILIKKSGGTALTLATGMNATVIVPSTGDLAFAGEPYPWAATGYPLTVANEAGMIALVVGVGAECYRSDEGRWYRLHAMDPDTASNWKPTTPLFTSSGTAPTSPQEFDIWEDTSSGSVYKQRLGGAWITIA